MGPVDTSLNTECAGFHVLSGGWLSVDRFAAIAGISERKARAALARCHAGKTWRGLQLTVRLADGAGGPKGLRYEVQVNSLPAELRPRSSLPATVTTAPLVTAAASREELIRAIIAPALRHAPRSVGRADVVRSILRRGYIAADGTRRYASENTLRRWIAAYEEGGIGALQRDGRADRGERRTLISRHWDQDSGLDEQARAKVAETLDRYIRSLWRSDVPGWRHAQRLASAELFTLTRAAGCTLADAALLALCQVPRHLVEQHRRYQLVAVQEQDAKRFFDRHQPRIRRHRDGLAPMEIVIADVHHFDILVTRPDGSLATPKAISWLDLATNRVFITPMLFEKGRAVRREHVADSFIAMATHPEWGLPRTLYCDNGGEYAWTDFVESVMKLAELTVRYLSDDPVIAERAHLARSAIVRARPYNAPAKPIEGVFAVLERGPLRMLPGWIGGDRMQKKTQNVGREPLPFPGTFGDFTTELQAALAYYETHPQFGHLKSRTPRQAFADAVSAGWRRVDIDRDAVSALFYREELRKVDQGAFSLDSIDYRHDALMTLSGSTVRLHVPLVGDKHAITVIGDDGRPICVARPDTPFGFLDRAGAREQSRRAKVQAGDIRELRRETDKLNLQAAMRAAAALAAPAPIAQSAGTVTVSDELRAVVEAKRALPPREKTTLSNRHARQIDAIDRLNAASRKAAG